MHTSPATLDHYSRIFRQNQDERSKDPASLPVVLIFLSAVIPDRTPVGRRPWMAGVFGPRQDAESENGDGTAYALSGFDVTRRVFSLPTFFAPAKKVGRRRRKLSPIRAKAVDGGKSDQNRFALSGESLFFAGAKKSNQKKAPSPTDRSRSVRCRHHFRTRHPWLGPKTAAIHGGRPPGVRLVLLLAARSRSAATAKPGGEA